jgi:hypothetical protein
MLQIYDLQHVIHNPDCIADNVFTILLINKGNGGCLINYDSYPLGENTAFCIYPGKFRSVKADYNVRGQVVFFSKWDGRNGSTSS